MSETLKNQIDLAAEYQKQHSHDGGGGILHDLKEGVKDVVDKVTGKSTEANLTSSPDKGTQQNMKTFEADHGLRNETFGASI